MSAYIPDPASEAEWTISAFLDALDADPTTSPQLDQLRHELAARFAEHEQKYDEWLVDDAALRTAPGKMTSRPLRAYSRRVGPRRCVISGNEMQQHAPL
jgi:hypothetical protein